MSHQDRRQRRNRLEAVRPTTSRVLSALFSMFGPEGVEGLSVLDLYAGTGGFGLEALRRGAERVVLVEKSQRRCRELEEASSAFGTNARARVVCADVLRALPTLTGQFDVVFADPPYADNPFEELARRLVSNGLLTPGGTVMLEHFHKTDLPGELAGLGLVTRRRYGDAAVSIYRHLPGGNDGIGKGA